MEYKVIFPEFATKGPDFIPYYAQDEMFAVERDFDENRWHDFVVRYWWLTIPLSAIYVILVFAGKRYMSERPKFDLRLPLAVWSGVLAVFSLAGTWRCLPEFLHILREYGFRESVCNPVYTFHSPGSFQLWQCLFILSKLTELGDTAFIVLRKQPLIFLHWYHHVTVMIYTWWSYTDYTTGGRWFMTMNYTVHSLMYTYYCLRALRVPVPKVINKVITACQIFQMILGIWINTSAYYYKTSGILCQNSYTNIYCSIAMYLSYFALFGVFFYSTYIRPSSAKNKREKTS